MTTCAMTVWQWSKCIGVTTPREPIQKNVSPSDEGPPLAAAPPPKTEAGSAPSPSPGGTPSLQ